MFLKLSLIPSIITITYHIMYLYVKIFGGTYYIIGIGVGISGFKLN